MTICSTPAADRPSSAAAAAPGMAGRPARRVPWHFGLSTGPDRLPVAPRCNAGHGGVGSSAEMPILPRSRSRESLDSVAAEELLNGRGAGSGAPAGQQALARVLAVASGPASDSELAGQAAALAAFAAATGPAAQPGQPRPAPPRYPEPAFAALASRHQARGRGRRVRNGAGRRRGLCQCPACPAPGTGPRHVRCPRPAACRPAALCHQRAARRPGPSGRTRAPPARPPEGPPGWRGVIRPPVTGSPIEAARPARRPASPVRTSTGRVRGAARPTRPIRPAATTFLGPAHDDATAARSSTGVRRSVRAPQAPHAARRCRPDVCFCHLHDRGRHRDARRAQGAVPLVGCASWQYCRPRASRDQG